MTTITVPAGAPKPIRGRNGGVYSTRMSEGRTVVDMTSEDIESLLSGPQGKVWVDANPGIAIRMLAPESVSSYSYGGTEFQIGDDRTVVVTAEVASVLRSHGFRDAPGS
jgi:hypothetical protein